MTGIAEAEEGGEGGGEDEAVEEVLGYDNKEAENMVLMRRW